MCACVCCCFFSFDLWNFCIANEYSRGQILVNFTASKKFCQNNNNNIQRIKETTKLFDQCPIPQLLILCMLIKRHHTHTHTHTLVGLFLTIMINVKVSIIALQLRILTRTTHKHTQSILAFTHSFYSARSPHTQHVHSINRPHILLYVHSPPSFLSQKKMNSLSFARSCIVFGRFDSLFFSEREGQYNINVNINMVVKCRHM